MTGHVLAPSHPRRAIVFLLALFLAAGTATANPIVSIGEGQTTSWADALLGLGGGTLQIPNNLTQNEIDFYTDEVGAGKFGVAENIADHFDVRAGTQHPRGRRVSDRVEARVLIGTVEPTVLEDAAYGSRHVRGAHGPS